MTFIHNESMTHHRAKHRLADWLAATPAGQAGHYCVAVEYAFTKCGLGVEDWRKWGWIYPPTYHELWRAGKTPMYFCDIVVIEGGRVTHAIEVVHTSPTTDDKIRWLRSYHILTHEAYAEQVMALNGPPATDEDWDAILREDRLRPISGSGLDGMPLIE